MQKLHVGCGQNYLPGYINLEFAEGNGKIPFKYDMLGTGMDLPFEENTLEEIISFHVIEHMPRPQDGKTKSEKWRLNVDDFLTESYRTLKYGGKFIAECPDVEAIIHDIAKNSNWDMINHLYGLDRYPGDTHQWGYTRKALKALLKKHGFADIKISDGTDYHTLDEPSLRIEATKIGLKRINIEPTSACNLECTICTRDEDKRPNANMDFDFYRSIIYQLFNLGLHDVEIRYFISGEPLVAGKQLVKMIKYATRYGFYNTLIHTNGTLLNKYGEGILEAGIGTVSISFDGADKETYEAIRLNSNFEITVQRVQDFFKRAENYKTKTIVQTIVDYGVDRTECENRMRNLLPGADEYYVRYPHNWNTLDGITGQSTKTSKVKVCFPSENLSIYADGKVPICCADLNGDFILADATKESLIDIWFNKLGDIRDRMKSGQSIPELCNSCERYSDSNSTTNVKQNLTIEYAEDLINRDEFNEAREILNMLLLEEPNSENILIDLGVLEAIENNYTQSAEYFEKALLINPKNTIAIENLDFIKQSKNQVLEK